MVVKNYSTLLISLLYYNMVIYFLIYSNFNLLYIWLYTPNVYIYCSRKSFSWHIEERFKVKNENLAHNIQPQNITKCFVTNGGLLRYGYCCNVRYYKISE